MSTSTTCPARPAAASCGSGSRHRPLGRTDRPELADGEGEAAEVWGSLAGEGAEEGGEAAGGGVSGVQEALDGLGRGSAGRLLEGGPCELAAGLGGVLAHGEKRPALHAGGRAGPLELGLQPVEPELGADRE